LKKESPSPGLFLFSALPQTEAAAAAYFPYTWPLGHPLTSLPHRPMKEINRQTLYDGYYKLYKVTLEHQGKTFDREVFKTGTALAALVYHTRKDKFIFVRQYRTAMAEMLTEMVAGLQDPEDPSLEEGLRREINEETGYLTDRLEPICLAYPSPGAFEEVCHLYYAEVSQQENEGGGNDEENENIELIELTPEETFRQEWRDAKTIIALQWYLLHKS
jgi:ADP-ribose pyrophosphatase